MKLYINNYDNEDIITIEVADTFKILRTQKWDEGIKDSDYEIAANKLREIFYKIVENPCEIYDDENCAKEYIDPLLCF